MRHRLVVLTLPAMLVGSLFFSMEHPADRHFFAVVRESGEGSCKGVLGAYLTKS